MKKLGLIVVITVVMLFSVNSCFAAGPWKGKVIEAGTKKPIEGAVVVAVWSSKTRLNPAGSSDVPIEVKETATNADGEFEFSSDAHIYIPILRESSGPDFLIYKPGYKAYLRAHQVKPHDFFENKIGVVELPKLEKKEERLKALHVAEGLYPGVEKNTPKLNQMLDEENSFFGFK